MENPNPFVPKRPCYWWDDKYRRPDMPPPDNPVQVEDWLTAWIKRDAPPSDEPKPDPK